MRSLPRWLGLPPAILAFLAVGLVLRLVWVAVHPVDPVVDFDEYHRHAATLAEHGIYSDNPDYHDAYWPPGWPALLSLLYMIVGVHARAGAFFGATLEWGAIVVAAVAATRLLRPAFAIGAVGAMCLYPGSIFYSPVLGTEHLTALLFTGGVVLVAFVRPSIRTALAAGLIVGALLLTRADYGWVFAVVLAIWLVRGVPVRQLAPVAAVAAVGALVFLGPWIVRNADRFGEFIPTSTNGGTNFYLGTVATRYSEPPALKRLRPTSTVHPKAHENRYYRMGLDNVADDPVRWLGHCVARIYHLYGREVLILYWGEIEKNGPAKRLADVYWVVILALAIVGFAAILLCRRRLPGAWFVIAGSILLVSVVKLAFLAEARHRLPLTYLLLLIAALGAQQLVHWRKRPWPS